MRRKGLKAHTHTQTHTHRSDWSCSDFSGCVGLVCTLRWHCTTLVAGSTTSYLAAASPAVGGGQADRVDDKVDDKVNRVDNMVVGDKLEERGNYEEKHDGASEEEEEDQAGELKVDKEEDVKDEEEEKEDKENEGTEDNPGEAELELSR